MLSFSIDKDSYEPGETVTAILPASAGGRALVTLENGSSVIQREWIEVSGKEDTKYQFKVTPETVSYTHLDVYKRQQYYNVRKLPFPMD